MSKYGVDERGWPLVPVEPAAIPNGYEPVRVGWAKGDEWTARSGNNQTFACFFQGGTDISCHSPFLIIRPIPKPIRLPLAIVPHGWWVAKDEGGRINVFDAKPQKNAAYWFRLSDHKHYHLPPWIAAQLPQEWHALPWDQSAVQQTEGGEG